MTDKDDELLPSTVSKWPTIDGKNIPRTGVRDGYKPPVPLSAFVKLLNEKDNVYAPFKEWALQLAEECRQKYEAERSAHHTR